MERKPSPRLRSVRVHPFGAAPPPEGEAPPDARPPPPARRPPARRPRARWTALAARAARVAALVAAAAAAAAAWYAATTVWWEPAAARRPLLGAGGGAAASEGYTVQILSHRPRLRALRLAARHYGRCAHAAEVAVIWDDGTPPPAERDLRARGGAPARVRVEPGGHSLNSRFRPDPALRTRAVFIADDDVLLRCGDVEAGFAAWRAAGGRPLVGFFPRRVAAGGGGGGGGGGEGGATSEGGKSSNADEGGGVYELEPAVFAGGRYNAVLTVAEFVDSRYYAHYWGVAGGAPGAGGGGGSGAPLVDPAAAAAARALVDARHNCEDLLINWVVGEVLRKEAAATAAAAGAPGGGAAAPAPAAVQAAVYVRPRRRLDLRPLSGVGISRGGAHAGARRACVAEFARLFGGVPMADAAIDWRAQPAGRPPCTPFGCVYL